MIKFTNCVILILFIASPLLPQSQLSWEPMLTGTNALAFALNPLDDKIVYIPKNGVFNVTYDGGLNWEQRGTVPDIEIRNISVCPADTAIILMYANGSIFRTEDGGWNWNEVLAEVTMDGETIEFHPTHPDSVFYVDFRQGNLWVSGNRGETWNIRSNVSLSFVCSFSINPSDPKKMIAGAGNTKINRSLDGGYTWQTVKSGNDYFSEIPKIKWDPTQPTSIFGATYLDKTYSVFRSTDEGSNWEKPGIFNIPMWALDIDPINGNIYIGEFRNEKSNVFKSYDHGDSWQKFGNIPATAIWMIKTANDSIVSALSLDGFFGIGGIYRVNIPDLAYLEGTIVDSISGLPVQFAAISIESTNDIVHLGNSDGTFTMAMLPGAYDLDITASGLSKTIKNVVFNGADTNRIQIDFPLDIRQLTLSGNIKDNKNNPIQSEVTLEYKRPNSENITRSLFTESDGFFQFDSLLSTNNFIHLQVDPQILPYFGLSLDSFSVAPDQNIILDYADVFLADGGGDDLMKDHYIQALDNAGITWVTSDNVENFSSDIIAKTKKQTTIWFARHDSSTIENATWDSLNHLINNGQHLIMSGQDMLERYSELELFKGLNVGFEKNYSIQGFVDQVKGFSNNAIGNEVSLTIRSSNQGSADILNYTSEYAAPAFYYEDGINDISNLAGVTLENTGNGGRALLTGFDLDLQSTSNLSKVISRSLDYFAGLTGIPKPFTNIAQKPDLMQNYPNPFNPNTTIAFRLTNTEKVTVKIYNAAGQIIKTLLQNERKSSGVHKLIWNGTTENGEQVASGIYFYKIKTNNFVQTKRMVIIH